MTISYVMRDSKAARGKEPESVHENQQHDNQREASQSIANILVYDLGATERVAERRAVAHGKIILLVLDLRILHSALLGGYTTGT